MKRYAILFIAIVTVQVILAQPYPRQECHILNNEKQLTDASVVLYHLHSEYVFITIEQPKLIRNIRV